MMDEAAKEPPGIIVHHEGVITSMLQTEMGSSKAASTCRLWYTRVRTRSLIA